MGGALQLVGAQGLAERVRSADWSALGAGLDARGWVTLPGLLEPHECRALAALYDDERRFRSTVVMARHGFGRGEYKYFAYPLPEAVAELRTSLYAPLRTVAERWSQALGLPGAYPETHAEFLARCHASGQIRPTPLLLRYGPGDFNALHQDLYGEQMFPLQTAVLLDEPGADFEGGEFVLVEQRPRMQSRATVVPLRRGDAVVFAVDHRPARGKRGTYRVTRRHGVGELRAGRRHTLGLILHDAA